ncbi:hypothetical protein MMC24_001050 [Lignoscripta atroalba]|nr:hypothetical protein [Lignoscripta atroalba]
MLFCEIRTNTSSLEVEDELLDRINSEFVKMVQLKDFSVYSFQESSGLSGLKGFSGKVVSGYSSKLDHPLEVVETIRGNHMEMARFSDANDEGYRTVSKVIARCVTDSQQDEKSGEPTAGNALLGASPATKEKRFIRIPHISNNCFIGRKKELLWLQAHLEDLASNEEQQRVVVWGPGGAGKTQLVSTYAFRNQSRYSAMFWVTTSSDGTLRKTYADIAKYLDLALPSGGDQQTAIDSVRNWFTDHEQGDWLLVIDNADKLDEVDIQSVIPPINKGRVIITSRNRQAAGLGTAIELGEMDAGDAVALLFRTAAIHHPTPMEEITGTEITKSLGYLALAIEHAGAYVQSVGGTLQDYLQQFQNNRRDTLEKSPAFSMHKESVFETFNMSFNAIMKRNMAAAKLLCFMGFLDAEGVLESLMLSTDERVTIFRDQVMKDQKEFFDGIQVLISFSLIRVKIEADKKSISLHPLVHYLSRARLNVENQWRWKARVVSWLVQLSVAADADMVYFPHVREQMQQMIEIKSFPADIQRRRSVYYCLALLQNHYRFAWQNQGAMDELYKYSEVVMGVLEEDLEDQEHLSIVAKMAIISVHATAAQFISSDSTFDQIVLRYLLKQMTPLARTALENASDSQKKSNTSDNIARTQMSLLSEDDDVKQDGLLTLHTLTTALTQTVNSGSLVAEKSIQEGVKAIQGSEAITISREETRKNTLEASDGLAECGSLRRTITSHDLVLTDQGPGNETPSRLAQVTEKNDDIDVISPSTTEPTTDSLSFRPKYLSDVFLSITPPVRVQCLLSLVSSLIKVYYHHHRVAEADLLMIYSTLPVESAEQPDHTPLQVSQLLIEASRLAATGDLEGMLSIFLKIISIGDGSTEVCYVSLDYAIIMNKLGRPAEAERVIKQIFYSKRTAQSIDPIKLDQDLARDLQSTYVWLKKTLSTSQRLQEHLDQSLQTLLMTLQTAQAVFGINSLSYLHAAFLLHRFYSCHYPQSQSKLECNCEAKKYMEMFVSVLESLYCSGRSGDDGKQVCNAEGLQMGVLLWAQGALEETVGVFDAFAQLTKKIMGENDVLSRKARKAAAIAKGEWKLCQKERREDVLKFGTLIFLRKVEDLALLLKDE